jgi:hypothetical protein
MNILVQWMFGICLEQFLVAFCFRFQQSGLFKPVQFQPDGIGTLIKFLGQSPEIGRTPRIQEELQDQFDAGFRSDEGV